ncbi:MAG TPA: protein-glutamate O-methyltransferase CheR [Vicinamibacterales bacterium]|jgi:chemotaxis protein methyltransferase CheR|nr:protein-glutamate O-methyltransferase CheR [Vicinamibacterales bacterium]
MTPLGSELLGIPQTGLPVLRDLIHERTGLFYDADRTELLAERVAPLVVERGFRSFLDLYYLLKYDDAASPAAWRQLMDTLSVPETYFWREMDQITAIVCRAVPELARRGDGVIRIWSAPCATGEEPLTIAMALTEAGWFDRVPIEIHGSDASSAAIDKARAGRYRQRSMRAIPPAILERYFTAADGTYVPHPSLTRRITTWSVVNLMIPEEVAPYARFPIVFCRNAFIYFSPHAIGKVVAQLGRSMPSPGYLCVGASESLLTITSTFALEEMDRAFVYVKRDVHE